MGDALNVKVNVSVDKSANLTCSQLPLGPSTKAKHALSQGEETGNPTFLTPPLWFGVFYVQGAFKSPKADYSRLVS